MFSDICKEYMINDHIQLTIIDIEEISGELRRTLDDNFVEICEGESGTDILTVKKRVRDLFLTKNHDWQMGATAEFFVHLYIRLNGFKQECLYLNLEENSIKKGFDGYYSLGGQEWLMESKAGAATSKNASHSTKVSLAMRDLEKKVSGRDSTEGRTNNPWQEAYSHASHIDVGTSSKIRKHIKQLANEFTNGQYHSIEEFNTMPCGTIFLGGTWIKYDHDLLKSKIFDLEKSLKGHNVHVICVTQKSTDLFLAYISKEA